MADMTIDSGTGPIEAAKEDFASILYACFQTHTHYTTMCQVQDGGHDSVIGSLKAFLEDLAPILYAFCPTHTSYTTMTQL